MVLMLGVIVMRTHSAEWYDAILDEYFMEHFCGWSEDAEFFLSPEPNVRTFDIPKLQKRVTLTCKDDGRVCISAITFRSQKEMDRTALLEDTRAWMLKMGDAEINGIRIKKDEKKKEKTKC